MAQKKDSKVIKGWSLIAFAREFGPKTAIGTCTNQETGEQFPEMSFTNAAGERKYVRFADATKGLTKKDIAEQKDELRVVEIEVDAKTLKRRKTNGYQLESYILCYPGENSWEEVDLGLE